MARRAISPLRLAASKGSQNQGKRAHGEAPPINRGQTSSRYDVGDGGRVPPGIAIAHRGGAPGIASGLYSIDDVRLITL
jgi:hypothetical protein